MDPREELAALRRMAELEAKASGGIPSGRAGVSQIPTEPGANLAPTVAAPQTLGQKIMGYVETPFAVAANLTTGPLTYLAGAGGPDFQRKVAGEIQYQPRTQQAQAALDALGSAAEASKLPPFMPAMGLAQSIPAATRATKDVTRAVAGADLPFGETTAAQALRLKEERIAQSVQNAARIEAAQTANKLGIALNPAISNPTTGNKLRSVVAGNQDLNAKLAEANNPKWTDLTKKSIGVEPGQVLDAKAIDAALEKHSAPYQVVANIPTLAPDAGVLDSLKGLVQRPTIGGESVANAINGLIEDAVNKVSAGRSGADVVRDIRQLRRDANNTYKSQTSGGVPSPEAIAAADTRIKIANSLEQLIDANVTDPNLLSEIRKSRAAQANIYDVERATNFATNKVDPQVFARMVAEGKPLSGVAADIGKIAANFPEIAGGPAVVANLQPRLTRSGIGGTLGALAGLAVGQPYAGAAIGAGAGALSSAVAAKRMGTAGYQTARAVPQDFRPAAPVAARPANALVPYRETGEVLMPGEFPNFTMQPNQYPPRTSFVGPETGGAPQLGMGREPVGGGQTAALRAEDARLRAMYEARDLQAQAAAAQAEAAARQPARGGTPLVFDERGRLVPADQTLRGATPDIQIIESTGKNLSGAAELLASGRSPALMSAEQKIAWEKTKVDLADVVPGMKALNEKALAAKMMDRAWVQDAIAKAREKAAAFDEMSKRATSAQRIREAAMKREQMLDAAEALQEQLGSRPVSSGSQGPKTQAAQRNKNAMRPSDVEIKNALIGK